MLTIFILLIIGSIAFVLLKFLVKVIVVVRKNREYADVSKNFREERKNRIDCFFEMYHNTITKEKQEAILESNAHELLFKLKHLEITSEEIVLTYGLRAKISLEFGCLADIDLEGALKVARMKDKERISNKELPPLHGLVLSVKDHITCEGFYFTAGMAFGLSLGRSKVDCNFVKVLKDEGVIFFCTSNIPQGLGSVVSSNKLFGNGLNPWNINRTVGGSSGGEAGLIATRTSPLGIGSDAAGSIRIPSGFCGIYGFVPTSYRISLKRTENLRTYDLHVYREIRCAYGPMGRCVDDLKLIAKSIFGKFTKYDFEVPPSPFVESKYTEYLTKKMRIGIFDHESFSEYYPGVKNVQNEVIQFLKDEGHEIIVIGDEWTLKFISAGYPVMQLEGFASNLQETLRNEYPEKYYWLQVYLSYLPRFLVNIASILLKFIGMKRLGIFLDLLYHKEMKEFHRCVDVKEKVRDDFFKMWKSLNVDALISPVTPFTALRHFEAELLQALLGSTFSYNILGCCCGVVPIRLTKANETHYSSKFKDLITLLLKSSVKGTENLPLAIQVAAMPYQDEICLALMKRIENRFQFHKFNK